VSLKFSYKASGSDMATKMIGAMLTRLPGSKSATVWVNTPPGQGAAAISDQVMEELHRRGMQSPAPIVSESMKVRSLGNGGNADLSGISIATHVRTEINASRSMAAGEKQTLTAANMPVSNDFDLHARVAIGKGPRGNPFTISSQSQREVVQALAWKSTLYIWGSPIFTLVCIYFLLVYWSWM